MSSRPLTGIVPRLEKLLLMLSSERDGEVVNAARAISRTLQTIGADWHDLTTGLLAPARSRTKRSRDNGNTRWRVMVGFCIEHEDQLRPREVEFVHSLLHWRGDLTEKQSAWLNSIYAQLQRATA